jgi:hypothetical protein
MKRLFGLLVAASLCLPTASSAWWQSIQQVAVSGGGGGGYVGPGDVKSGWSFFYGTRAYSAATRGNRLVNICNSTGGVDVLCADASSDPVTGSLVIPGSLTSFCPGPNCTMKIFYDLTLGTAYCGGSPCDISIPGGNISQRPILTASAIGTKTCGVGSGTQSQFTLTLSATISQPFSMTGVAKYGTVASGNPEIFGMGGSGGVGFGTISATSFGFYSPGNVSGNSVDTSPHAFQAVANSTSSFFVEDTSTSALQNGGTAAATSQIAIFSDTFSNFMIGAVCEAGTFPGALSGADATAMYNNQHLYWGF